MGNMYYAYQHLHANILMICFILFCKFIPYLGYSLLVPFCRCLKTSKFHLKNIIICISQKQFWSRCAGICLNKIFNFKGCPCSKVIFSWINLISFMELSSWRWLSSRIDHGAFFKSRSWSFLLGTGNWTGLSYRHY